MTELQLLHKEDLDVDVDFPEGLHRVVEQNLVNLAPWQIIGRELALKRMRGLRERYPEQYVPFAMRRDNDDLACIDPDREGLIVIIHDFSGAGSERRQEFQSFWDWFRAAIEDMILFE